MPLAAIGMPDRWDTDYPGHRWDYPLQRILVAARAAGVRAIDGPFADFRDLEGFRRPASRPGRSATTASGASTPIRSRSPTRLHAGRGRNRLGSTGARSRTPRLSKRGRGSFALNGQMVDAATLRMARATLARSETNNQN